MTNTIQRLRDTGQSIWCDHISRSMIDGGGLQRLIDQGIVGVTSNPTILMKAITGSSDYDGLMAHCHEHTADIMAVYEDLVVPDIAAAADLLKPVYDRTEGVDGYVSLEVNPKLSADTAGTIDEARRLWSRLNRPNILIKVPATDEGIPAVETLIGEGINVNVTLIFSIETYERVILAYVAGLDARAKAGHDLHGTASVASFFVSRLDTAVDAMLVRQKASGRDVDHLLGAAAVANARLAYGRFRAAFGPSSSFAPLAAQGARVQRPLWASTGTKNPAYSDTKYCDELVAPNTVNTLPPASIETVLDRGSDKNAIPLDLSAEQGIIDELRALGIDLGDVTDKLRIDGVASFRQSFDQLLDNLTQKCGSLNAAG